jgi:hypothetical protein
MSKILLMGVSCLLLLAQVNEASAMQGPPPPPGRGVQGGVGKGLLRANLNFLITNGMITLNPPCNLDGIVHALIEQGRLSISNLPECTGVEGGVAERMDRAPREREEEVRRPMTGERLKRMGGQRMVGEESERELREKLDRRRKMEEEWNK